MTQSVVKLLLALSIVGWGGVARAGTPPSVKQVIDHFGYHVWSLDAATQQWKYSGRGQGCAKDLAKIDEDGVADTLSVEFPYDTPDLKKGPHTVKEIKDLCKHVVRSHAMYAFVSSLRDAWNDDQGDIAARCIQIYGELVNEDGHTPTTMLPYEGMTQPDPATGDPFSGTVEEARKKFCDVKAQKYLGAIAAAEAPYRKVLKADKLQIALGHLNKQIYSAGKKKLDDPKQLLKANVWFRHVWYDDHRCKQGADKQHVVHRYQFNAKQGLLKQTQKTYCGEPPSSAFK